MNVRRPMVLALLATMAGCVIARFASMEMAIVLLCAAMILLYENRWRGLHRNDLLVVGLLVLFLGSGFFRMWDVERGYQSLQAYDGTVFTLEGVVLQNQVKGESVKMIVDSHRLHTKVMIQFWMEEGETFDGAEGCLVKAEGRLQVPKSASNPHTFDYRQYLKGRNVGLLLDCEPQKVRVHVAEGNWICSLRKALGDFRLERREQLLRLTGEEEGSLLVGMLLGDKSLMEEDVYQSFQENGIAHILCVSGIHISIVCGCLERILVGRNKYLRSMLVLMGLFFYGALAAFAPSVMRGVWMVVLSVLAKLLLQRYDRLSALAGSCFVMVLWNPWLLFQAGFQLSYMAVASLVIVLPWLEAWGERLVRRTEKEWIRSVGSVVWPLLALQVVMAPVTAYLFNYVSFSAFFLNGPILLAAGLVIPCGMFLLIWPPFLCQGVLQIPIELLGEFTKILLHFMTAISQGASAWSGASRLVISPSIGVLLLFYGMVGYLCSECCHMQKRRGQKKRMAALLATVMVISNVGPWLAELSPSPLCWTKETYDVVFVDVGQGDCVHIHTPSGKNVLIDGGGSKTYSVGEKILLPYLLKNGVKEIDLAIVTHLHDDHFLGIRELASSMHIRQLGFYDINRYRPKQWQGEGFKQTQILFLAAGDRIPLDEGVWIDVIWPKREPSKQAYAEQLEENFDENDNSLVMCLSYLGTRILLTGDFGQNQEEALLASLEKDSLWKVRADLLKVGHHGSRYATKPEFVEAVRPKGSVISVGKNNFGHPAKGVIELLQNYDIMVYRTDLQGAILLRQVGNKHARITTMR